MFAENPGMGKTIPSRKKALSVKCSVILIRLRKMIVLIPAQRLHKFFLQ